MKKINPKDLVKGKKYLVELEFNRDIIEGPYPLQFTDTRGGGNCLPLTQPIYTLEEDQPIVGTLEQTGTDPELEMLVNVAIALMINDLHFTENEIEEELGHKLSEDKKERAKQWASAYKKLIARDAADLIAACKRIKEGER